MTTISLKVPDELVARMDAVARANRTNRSALLREALEDKLKAAARKTPPSLFERVRTYVAKDAAGWVIWLPTQNTSKDSDHE